MEKYLYIALATFALMACGKQEGTKKEVQPIKVSTMILTPQPNAASSRYVGTVEPVHATPLSLQTTGRVVSVNAKNGQRVTQGQVLLVVDNTQALIALNGAEATLKQAQDGYDRVSKVHSKGVVSDQQMVEIESKLAQAQSLYETAKRRVEECKLVAPCDGVVDGLDVEIGQSVLPDMTLCSLLDVSGFNVRFTVPEAEIHHLPQSGEMECAAVGKSFPVTLREKRVAANLLTHTYDVVARVQGGTDVLMTGMVGKVVLEHSDISRQPSDIVIPARCILLKPEGHTVWVVGKDQAERREISIDGYQADGVRVKSGLRAGERIVTDGYQKLYNGCRVEW